MLIWLKQKFITQILPVTFIWLLSFFMIPAAAQDSGLYAQLKEGETIVSLSATERREIEEDMLTANLNFIARGATQQEVQNKINQAMKQAISVTDNVEDVRIETGHYSVYPRRNWNRPKTKDTDNEQDYEDWHGQQGLSLSTTSAQSTLLDLVKQLQSQGFSMQNLSYSLSAQKREEVTESLTEAALIKLETRAKRIANALGRSGVHLAEINIDGGPQMRVFHSRSMAMAESASADMETPVARPGMSNVTLTVSARAIIKP